MTDVPPPAIVLLVHAAPHRVRRLIDALDPLPVIVHFDAKSSDADFAALTRRLPGRVIVAPRRDTRIASWSLVAAEIDCLRLALGRTDAEHIAVLSGSDYPLASPTTLAATLARYAGRTLMRNEPMPYRPWDTRLFPDGGLWRLKFHYFTRHEQMTYVHGHPACIPIRRRLPPDVVPTASEQWKVFCRRDAAELLAVVDRRRDLVRFGRSCYIPDESFFASLLASPSLFPRAPLRSGDPGAWSANWAAVSASQHPGWYASADVPALRDKVAIRAAEVAASGDVATPLLFARKFATNDEAVLDRIERDIW